MAMAKGRITQEFVAQTKADSKDTIYWDKELVGFGLRVHPSGTKTYIVQYRVGRGKHARQRRISLGSAEDGVLSCQDARQLSRDFRAEARTGTDPEDRRRVDELAQMKMSDLLEDWAREAAPVNRRTGAPRKERNYKQDIALLQCHVLPILGSRRITELKRYDIERLRDAITRGDTRVTKTTKLRGKREVKGGAGTATRTVSMLKSVFGYAIDRELLEKNPCDGIRLVPSKKRERYLSVAEAARLGETLSRWESKKGAYYAVTIIRLLSLTGARRGEITELKWSEIDFDRSFLRLAETKTGKSIRPISGAARDLLASLPKRHAEWVFPDELSKGPYQGLGKIWRKIRVEADLEDLRMHDLRHSFASFAASNGLSLPIIGVLLGHTNTSSTARYAHLADAAARQAANSVADTVASALGLSKSTRKASETDIELVNWKYKGPAN